MCRAAIELFSSFLLFLIIHNAYSGFEFTNLKCISHNESFSTFEYCFLKAINRTYKYASIKVKLHEVPIKKVKVNFALYQRLNGYKPFLYNVTFDGCKYLLNMKGYPVATYIFNLFAPYSNINHSCPYDHDLIVEKLPFSYINDQMSIILPFPKSSYAFFSEWYSDGIKRVRIECYGTLT
ncbi:GM25974 [Drosophila sechellia]|uniref:GM25974 n=1 Tax=Drosophila sechellia TaxID=7238 RepID=B4HGE4_DROSE|nr:GM25974 [Drosophila sechellia]